jgi:hypothetical protein
VTTGPPVEIESAGGLGKLLAVALAVFSGEPELGLGE